MTDVNYAVLDLETTIRNKDIGNNMASPFFPDNRIVLGKYRLYRGDSGSEEKYIVGKLNPINLDTVNFLFESANLLVGHNIKFDLLHMRKEYNALYNDWVKRDGLVWDTQVVEYLISGQSHLYPSLDQCALKYGGTIKDDKIKQYWKDGIDTTHIPYDELKEYLDEDINNTEIVFNKQWEIVEELGMLPLVITQMRALLALVEIEYNGLYFDEYRASLKCDDLEEQLASMELSLVSEMETYLPNNINTKVNPSSPKQLSAIFFGGKVPVVEIVNVLGPDGLPIEIKSGKNKGSLKTKKVTKFVDSGTMGLTPTGPKGKNGCYSTDDETLHKLKAEATAKHDMYVAQFIETLINYRELAKDISTYYKGYSSLVFPDGFIHPNFNQCATATGRLSSTNPNAQNLTKEDS